MNKIALWGCVGLALLLGIQQWRIGHLNSDLTAANRDIKTLKTDRDELARSLTSSEADNAALNKEIKRREQLLLERNKVATAQRKQLAELTDKLDGLRKTNENVKSWSNARVPDDVIRLLGSSGQSSDRPDRASKNSSAG